MSKFIKTSDKGLAIKLTDAGLVCCNQEQNGKDTVFVFINDAAKLPMAFADNTNLFFTDKLMF